MKDNHTLRNILSLGSRAEIDEACYLEVYGTYLKMPFKFRKNMKLNDRLVRVNGKALFNYASIIRILDLMLYYNEPK